MNSAGVELYPEDHVSAWAAVALVVALKLQGDLRGGRKKKKKVYVHKSLLADHNWVSYQTSKSNASLLIIYNKTVFLYIRKILFHRI